MISKAIISCIKEFIARYNDANYEQACQFYADEVLYYDGASTSKKSRTSVRADIEQAVAKLFGTQPIVVIHRDIDLSIDGRSALVHMRFGIGDKRFAVQMIVKWIDGRPQVTYDRTIATL